MTRSNAMQRIIVGAMLLGLCACGSGDDPASGSVGAAATADTGSDPASGKSAAPDAPAVGSETAADLPKQLCQFLKQEVPRLKERGSSVGALAGFAVDYAGWVEKDANRKFENAQELDAITTASCPKVRDDVLAVLESPSFSTVLGS